MQEKSSALEEPGRIKAGCQALAQAQPYNRVVQMSHNCIEAVSVRPSDDAESFKTPDTGLLIALATVANLPPTTRDRVQNSPRIVRTSRHPRSNCKIR